MRGYSLPDYNSLHEAHERERRLWLNGLPRCTCCGEPVTDEYFYDLGGSFCCEDCRHQEYRKSTYDFIRG